MTPTVSIRKALRDPSLLGNVLAGETWRAWRVLLIASLGEALDDTERAIFAKLTGRNREPGQRIEEAAFIVGRRGGKSRTMATLAAYLGGLCKHPLVRGEKGVLLCVAPDQRQAGIVLDYATAAFEQSPVLRQLIRNRTVDTLELTNGISVEVRASSFRRLRGPTYVAVICDEAAFWFSDELAANTDAEIVNACRPGLATTGGPLVIASSPYSKMGLVWDLHRQHYGSQGDPLILVAQGASRELNPSLSEAIVARALARDEASARAEYLGQFRDDIAAFIDRDRVLACVEPGVFERPPVKGTRSFSFTDPSGGSSDSMCAAVGFMDGDLLVVSAIREIKAPFDPESATEEIAQMLVLYKIDKTVGDRYSGQWCAQAFEKRGIKYEHAELNRSQLYLELLPRVNAKTIRLLDHSRAINQICMLQRRTTRGRNDTIDHPDGAHDDIANAIAGLCGLASAKRSSYDSSLDWVGGPAPGKEEEAIAAGVIPPPRVDPRLGLSPSPRRRWDHDRGWH
jgi:hypothetical protein